MNEDNLRERYIHYIREFNEKLAENKIIKKDGLLFEKNGPEDEKALIRKLDYPEWLLEKIYLLLREKK